MTFLSSPGSCSFEVMPGTLRNIYVSASLSGLQAGSVSSSTGTSTMSWCVLDSSLYWWFRLWRLRRFLVGCARFVCRGWEGSLLSFSPWMRILRLKTRSTTQLFSSSACWFARKTHRWSFTRKVCNIYLKRVHMFSVQFKTTLCRMLGRIGLFALAEIRLAAYRFREMPTTLKITGPTFCVSKIALAARSTSVYGLLTLLLMPVRTQFTIPS